MLQKDNQERVSPGCLSEDLGAPSSQTTQQGNPERDSACVVCRLTTRSVIRWIRAFLDEYVNDPTTRETIRRAQGFCGQHTRMLEESGDSLAVAILYGDLARLTCERWGYQNRSGGKTAGEWMGRIVVGLEHLCGGKPSGSAGGRDKSRTNRWGEVGRAPCPACIAHEEAQVRFVQALACGMEKIEIREAMDRNAGLCVPHIQQLIDNANPEAAQYLIEREKERLTALSAELGEIVRKNDYRFRGEPWGQERDAWRRALDKLKRQN